MAIEKLAFRTTIQVPELIVTSTDDRFGTKTTDGPLQPHALEVYVDLPKLVATLGKRAVRSRSGRAGAMGKIVVVKHVRSKRRGS